MNQKYICFLVATFFGIGKLPGWISYVLASLMAVPVTYLLFWASAVILPMESNPLISQGMAILLLGVLSFIAAKAAGIYAKQIGSKDPASVVVDEVIGQSLCFILALPQTLLLMMMYQPPIGMGWSFLIAVAVTIALFRLFDSWKPWPIYKLEQIKGGAGIVLDDLAAGVFAAVAYYLLSFGAIYFLMR